MKKFSNLKRSIFLVLIASVFASPLTYAQSKDAWPSRPVRFYVPFPAGSAPDVLLRHLGVKLTEKWGHQVIIDNRPGASGIVGVNAMLAAPTDGYSFAFAQGSALAIVPKTLKAATYSYERDFVPVAMVATSPITIAVPVNSPYKNLADLVKDAKLHPTSLELADVGAASVPHLAAEMIGLNSGTRFLHVHYQGGPPAIQATVGGQTKAVFETLGPLLGMVQGNKLRILASMSDQVEPGLEPYPLAKSTVKDAVAQGWFAVVAKKGVDPVIVKKLNEDINSTLKQADIIAKFKELAAFPRPGTPEDLNKFVLNEEKHWAKIINRLGLKPE
jgi:tripartite-type tricarboxylate transporter receptor subunit TctC